MILNLKNVSYQFEEFLLNTWSNCWLISTEVFADSCVNRFRFFQLATVFQHLSNCIFVSAGLLRSVCACVCVSVCVPVFCSGGRRGCGVAWVVFLFFLWLCSTVVFSFFGMKLSVELYLFQTFDCEMVVILVTFEGKSWTILDLYVASFCQWRGNWTFSTILLDVSFEILVLSKWMNPPR